SWGDTRPVTTPCYTWIGVTYSQRPGVGPEDVQGLRPRITNLRRRFGLLGFLASGLFCCFSVVSCCKRQDQEEYRKKAAAIESFLEPSKGVVEIVRVRVEHQLTVNGRYTDSDLAYTVESPATGKRRTYRADLMSAGPPAQGESWHAVVSRDGNR